MNRTLLTFLFIITIPLWVPMFVIIFAWQLATMMMDEFDRSFQ